jgi:hypothetical protein
MNNLKRKSLKTGGNKSLGSPESSFSFLGNLMKFKLEKNFLKLFLIIFLSFITISGSNSSLDPIMQGEKIPEIVEDPHLTYVKEVNEKFYNKLVSEVDSFIRKMAPESKLTPKYLVDKCLEYDTDIHFVLAQGLLESHFGTRGKANETNSVWNVGTYDDGQILYTYDHPDNSVDPYLKLINEKYLVAITSNGDTIKKPEELLVEDRGYINLHGLRFASARGYENAMRKLMIRIDSETSIKFYQEILRLPSDHLLAYFAPTEELPGYNLLQAMN